MGVGVGVGYERVLSPGQQSSHQTSCYRFCVLNVKHPVTSLNLGVVTGSRWTKSVSSSLATRHARSTQSQGAKFFTIILESKTDVQHNKDNHSKVIPEGLSLFQDLQSFDKTKP